MITITLHLFFMSLGQWHFTLGFDLPSHDFRFGLGPIVCEITTSPAATSPLPGSRAIAPTGVPNMHPAAGNITNLSVAPEPAAQGITDAPAVD